MTVSQEKPFLREQCQEMAESEDQFHMKDQHCIILWCPVTCCRACYGSRQRVQNPNPSLRLTIRVPKHVETLRYCNNFQRFRETLEFNTYLILMNPDISQPQTNASKTGLGREVCGLVQQDLPNKWACWNLHHSWAKLLCMFHGHLQWMLWTVIPWWPGGL